MPRAARKRFASGMVISPKWNTEAASTASARPSLDALGEVLERAHAAARDHRHRHRLDDRARELEVEAALRAVAVHAREQDLARAALRHLARPFYGIESARLAPAVRVDLPASRRRGARVDRHHDRLRAEARAPLPRRASGFSTAAVLMLTLSAPGVEELAHVLHPAHAAAHRERDEDLVGHALDHVDDRVARVAGGGDVEEGELVGARLVVAARDLDRIARVAQLHEVHALHDAAGVHVEARDDALGETHGLPAGVQDSPAASFSAAAKSSLPS